jgi:hypothetical protein
MIQLQNLHLCIFSAKWEEEKKREATEEKRRKKTPAPAAPRNLARGVGGRKASKEERIMLATLLSEPNKVPQVISSVLCGGKKGRKD